MRIKEQRRSSGFYAGISIATPPFAQTPNLLNEMDTKDTKQKEMPFSKEIFLKLEINLSH